MESSPQDSVSEAGRSSSEPATPTPETRHLTPVKAHSSSGSSASVSGQGKGRSRGLNDKDFNESDCVCLCCQAAEATSNGLI